MQFEPLKLTGAFRITPEPFIDARGSFTRWFDTAEFNQRGLVTQFAQHATSENSAIGTLRGLHYQMAPDAEVKLVRCTRGRIYDVIVDIRTDSPTYLQHVAFELREDSPSYLYIPAGCAHGFLTLTQNAIIEYHISQPYMTELQQGLRWNDSKLGIHWPGEIKVIAERDANFALL